MAAEEVSAATETDLIEDLEKCIKLFAQNVSKNVKYHSSLQKASLFCVLIAIETRETEIKKTNSNLKILESYLR